MRHLDRTHGFFTGPGINLGFHHEDADLDWLSYRVIHVSTTQVELRQSWTLLRNEVAIAVFASRSGAEAEGRRLAHADCVAGQNVKLRVQNADGSLDAEFTFTAPSCDGEQTQ